MKILFLLISITFFLSCNQSEQADLTKVVTELNADWEFRKVGDNDWFPAKVPGTVHSDLMNNKIISDYKIGYNEDSVQWVENEDWEYKTIFLVSKEVLENDNIELQFFGLDTYADIFLNEEKIGSSKNMYVKKDINVKEKLKEGKNELRVYFSSPVRLGLEKLKKQPYLLQVNVEPKPENERTRVYTRKAPFHYGWDWGPRLVTSGIWRPVQLVAYSGYKLEDVHIETSKIESDKAILTVDVEIEAIKGLENVSVEIEIDGTKFEKKQSLAEGSNTISFEMDVKKPKLWWCHGLGEPNLYAYRVSIDGIESYAGNVGIRKVELVQEPDSIGRSFYFKLNGVPVFSKGANYIPSETLTPLQTEKTYRKVLQDALDANMNMLRVWGGAIYEDDLFYDLCDQKGIMVWQDFMFACDMNPWDEEHLANIKEEAVYNVKRLRNHPSMVLWCGNNENLEFWELYGWKEKYNEEQQKEIEEGYRLLFYDLLPKIVKELDPELAYWASSPQTYDDLGPDRKSGDEHDWAVWFGNKLFDKYEEEVPRFCSEYGLQSYPAMAVLRTFASEEDMDNDSKLMRHRQNSYLPWLKEGWDGNDHMKQYAEDYYGVVSDFEDFVYSTQLMQAFGLKQGIETHRRNMPRCMGSLYWQINDCWPAPTWSSVDYYGNWKASHYKIKKAFEKNILSLRVKDGKYQVLFASDSQEESTHEAVIEGLDFSGNEVFKVSKQITNIPNEAQVIYEGDISKLDTSNIVFRLTLKQSKGYINTHFLTRPKWLNLPKANVAYDIITKEGRKFISLSSDVFVHGVYISTKSNEIKLSDNYINLFPGSKILIEILEEGDFKVEDMKIVCFNNILIKNR